jgi:hypothetical protein
MHVAQAVIRDCRDFWHSASRDGYTSNQQDAQGAEVTKGRGSAH